VAILAAIVFGAVRQIIGYFIAAVILLAGLGGLYLLGDALHKPWIFWLSVALAAAYAVLRYVVRWVGPFRGWLRERIRRNIDYPRLQVQVNSLTAENQALRNAVGIAKLSGERSYQAGLREARQQLAGVINAIQVKQMPTIMSVSLVGGRLQLTCHREGPEEVPINARFSVAVIGSNQPLGALVITGVSDGGQTLTAEPVEETDAAFWQHLREQADHDHAAPNGIKLGEYSLPDLPPLSPEPPVGAEGDNQPQLGGPA
jgi:hypothetical protein